MASGAQRFPVMAEKTGTSPAPGLSFRVFERTQQRGKDGAAGLEVHQGGVSYCASPTQWLKVCGSSLTDVGSSAPVYHFVVDSTGAAI